MMKECPQARSRFSIPSLESLGIACGDPLPEFPVIQQIASPLSIRAEDGKSSELTEEFSQKARMPALQAPLWLGFLPTSIRSLVLRRQPATQLGAISEPNPLVFRARGI